MLGEIRKTFQDSQIHGLKTLLLTVQLFWSANYIFIRLRQHRKINSFGRSKEDNVKVTISHTWASSNDSLLKPILSYAAILREAPDWTVVMIFKYVWQCERERKIALQN